MRAALQSSWALLQSSVEKLSWNSIGISLMIVGSAVFIVGMVVVLFSLRYIRKIRFGPYKHDIYVWRFASSTYDVQALRQDVELDWKEKNGKEVLCVIQERTLPLASLQPKTYADGTGVKGSLTFSLPPGAYLICFQSTNGTEANVVYEIKGTEYKPLKEYLPIGLTLLTIGTVLAVNGLTMFLRG